MSTPAPLDDRSIIADAMGALAAGCAVRDEADPVPALAAVATDLFVEAAGFVPPFRAEAACGGAVIVTDDARALALDRLRPLAESVSTANGSGDRDAWWRLGWAHEASLQFVSTPAAVGVVLRRDQRAQRRAAGRYYTPPALVDGLIDPVFAHLRDAPLHEITILDPAAGAGHLLAELGSRLSRLPGVEREQAFAAMYGIDIDPVAVAVCRNRLWLSAQGEVDPTLLARQIRVADSLVESPQAVFPAVFGARGGFDAVVANPPWIAHAGRAAQPMPAERRAHLRATNPGMHRYPTTHGAFTVVGARALRPGGLMAFLLPTSVSDLDGYGPTRSAVAECCTVREPVWTFGAHEFPGVFQPAMLLLADRTAGEPPPLDERSRVWPAARTDLSRDGAALLTRLGQGETLPAAMFAERGLQTDAATRSLLRSIDQATQDDVAIRAGRDVDAGRLLPVRTCVPRTLAGPRLTAQIATDVVIRQTARFPIAARHDGTAFRNSLLAADAVGAWTPSALVAYLNSTLLRWFHHQSFRDAREGMPQVKIGHLRSLPAPRDLDLFVRRVDAGDHVDGLVAASFELSSTDLEVLDAWMVAVGSTPRGR